MVFHFYLSRAEEALELQNLGDISAALIARFGLPFGTVTFEPNERCLKIQGMMQAAPLISFWERQTDSNISPLQVGHDGIFRGAGVTGQ